MADSDRVAGIYSEIKYRFDRKSIQNLRKFKRDLLELKNTLQKVKKLTKGSVKLGVDSKAVKSGSQVAKSAKQSSKSSEDAIKSLGKQNSMRARSDKIEMSRIKQRAAVQKSISRQSRKASKDAQRAVARTAQARIAKGNKESTIRSARGGFGRAASKAGTDVDARRLRVMQRMLERLNRQYRSNTIGASQYGRQVSQLTRQLGRNGQAAQRSAMSFNKLRTAVAGATGAYSAFAGAAGIKAIGGDFEDVGIMLETALGKDAGNTMKFLINQSKRLGLDAAATAKGFARYSLAAKQMGFTTAELKEQFLGVAEAATVFGLRQDEITGTIRAMEQIASKGQVMAEELNIRFAA